MDINDIIVVGRSNCPAFVPPLSDYQTVSANWTEAEFPCLDVQTSRVRAGFWVGEPGEVALHPWPYTEVCAIVTGRVAVVDLRGGRREFGPSESFIILKGFSGSWLTLVPSSKTFLAIY